MLYAVKNCGLALKDVDTERGTVSGYFSEFNSQDSDEDIILPGAYDKTVQENGPESRQPRIKHFLDHDPTKVPSVLTKLAPDTKGLRYDGKTGRHTLGRDFLLMCQDGIITEHSVGFETVKSEKNTDSRSGRGQIIQEIKLWEGSSLQAWGANPNTPLLGAKSLSEADRVSLLAKMSERLNTLTRALKGAYSDDLCERLEIQAAQLDALCKSLFTAPLDPEQPATPATEKAEEPGFDLTDLMKAFTPKSILLP